MIGSKRKELEGVDIFDHFLSNCKKIYEEGLSASSKQVKLTTDVKTDEV